jgi:beta-lactamase class D
MINLKFKKSINPWIKFAGATTKTVATNKSKSAENKFTMCLNGFDMYLSANVGSVAPLFLKDTIPIKKSCTAPANIQPNTIQNNATGPYSAAKIGPNTGPVPAMFNRFMRLFLFLDMAIKSMPSFSLKAGVIAVESMFKIFSMILEYIKYPKSNNIHAQIKVNILFPYAKIMANYIIFIGKTMFFINLFVFIFINMVVLYAENLELLKSKESCFLLYDIDNNSTVIDFGGNNCAQRIAPNSTFKIPLSVMAFDTNIINQNTIFKWNGHTYFIKNWNQDQTPRGWLVNSPVWVSQILSKQIGRQNIQKYLKIFSYGNQDFSGDRGKNNALEKAWLNSSLQISPKEQLLFLLSLYTYKFDVSKDAIDNTLKNIYEEQVDEIKLYGKTGSGCSLFDLYKICHGWYVGYVIKNNKQYVFVALQKEKLDKSAKNKLLGGDVVKPQVIKFLKSYN